MNSSILIFLKWFLTTFICMTLMFIAANDYGSWCMCVHPYTCTCTCTCRLIYGVWVPPSSMLLLADFPSSPSGREMTKDLCEFGLVHIHVTIMTLVMLYMQYWLLISALGWSVYTYIFKFMPASFPVIHVQINHKPVKHMYYVIDWGYSLISLFWTPLGQLKLSWLVGNVHH